MSDIKTKKTIVDDQVCQELNREINSYQDLKRRSPEYYQEMDKNGNIFRCHVEIFEGKEKVVKAFQCKVGISRSGGFYFK